MKRTTILCTAFLAISWCSMGKVPDPGVLPAGVSVYEQRPDDPEAVYFTPENFGISNSGKQDVSDALQRAINQVKTVHHSGVLLIPPGTYLISKTIYVPGAVRLIGYGEKRPLIILKENSPGFQTPDSLDKGKARYMFWFTSGVVKPHQPVHDAGAGTFYSALSNVDLKIGDGNPQAVALRTHFAQHCFVENVDIHIGQGKAGVFDVGNEMQNVRFYGGDYGIYTTKTSPGWPFMMIDTYFQGQRKAAIRTREAGLTIVRMQVRDVPTVIETVRGFWEKLFMKDCSFEGVSGPALVLHDEDNASNSVSLRDIVCKNVPVFAASPEKGSTIPGPGAVYRVSDFTDGLQIDDLDAEPVTRETRHLDVLSSVPVPRKTDIPALPPMSRWVNLKSLGAKGDGVTDDTRAIQAAIDRYPDIYVPQGWYRVTQTIHLKPGTVLIGLDPISTQFILAENTEAFGSFGGPRPLIEAPKGGVNILTGIGLSTGKSNSRAVACKWMAGTGSLLNDVKFVGGHGSIARPGHSEDLSPYNPESMKLWDSQYWSLWVTDGGGGVFKDIWTASTYASSGAYISHTATPGVIYDMSVEHHHFNEIRFNRVSNWQVYALQLEEESRESSECQPMELEQCDSMVFANLYMFRVIRITTPYPYSIRNSGSRHIELLNVHNYSQIKYTTNVPLYDLNSGVSVRPWEFTRLYLSGKDPRGVPADTGAGIVQRLATGFEFAGGLCSDHRGNVYFCDSRKHRIYRWSARDNSVSLFADYPWEPLSLACDRDGRLLVVFKYVPKPGYLKDGKPEVYTNPPDASGTSFSGWGNSGFGTLVYSVDPDNPDETIRLLPTKAMGSVPHVWKALYPAHRWRDGHDFDTITVARPATCFVAPDGVTIIPVVYDLARAAALTEAFPGKPAYVADEYNKRTVRLEVDRHGYVSGLSYFAERGEFDAVPDNRGDVYIADGQVYRYDRTGRQTGEIKIPERPSTMVFSGPGDDLLYVTGRTSLYRVKIP